jgi:putative sterol carrier protein
MAEQVTSVKNYFDTLPDRFIASASKGVKAVIQFDLAGDGGGSYHVTIDDGTMSTTIKMNADEYVKMVNGKLSGTMAFMKGLLKVSGNVMLAQKMQAFLPPSK